MAHEIALEILYKTYGKEHVELLAGNMAKTPDGVVTLLKKTNMRHEIAAQLSALGVRQNKIEQLLKRDKTKPSSGYYSRVLKNPMITEKQQAYALEVADKAKIKLTGVVEKAAENLEQAVKSGHLPSSLKVLQMADVINPVQKKEITKKVLFGAWLNADRENEIPYDPVQAAKKITEVTSEVEEGEIIEDLTSDIATCTDDMDESDIGERLDNNLFGDKDG